MEPEVFSVLGLLKDMDLPTLIVLGVILIAWELIKLKATTTTASSVKVLPDALAEIKNTIQTHVESTDAKFKKYGLEILALDGKIEAVHQELKEHKANDHKPL